MIEQLLAQDEGLFDVINPISLDFCMYWKPEGGLLTYGWNFDGPPVKGLYLKKMESPGHEVWVESKSEDSPYIIETVRTFERSHDDQNPEGVQRIHWVTLAEASAT